MTAVSVVTSRSGYNKVMRQFPRARRLVKWIGTVVCMALLVAALVCVRWEHIGITDRESWHVALRGGHFYGAFSPIFQFAPERFMIGSAHKSWRQAWTSWNDQGFWPRYQYDSDMKAIVLPLWIPFFLIGIPTALLWRIDRRRTRSGRCTTCGYDLTGNVSGRCPECGTAAEK